MTFNMLMISTVSSALGFQIDFFLTLVLVLEADAIFVVMGDFLGDFLMGYLETLCHLVSCSAAAVMVMTVVVFFLNLAVLIVFM